MQVNVNHILSNVKLFPELYLFLRIRSYAKNRGGRFTHMDLTKHERYVILPRIAKLNWVDMKKMRIVSYRRICNKGRYSGLFVHLDDVDLENKNRFKGFIIALAETAIIRYRWLLFNGRLKELDIRSRQIVKRLWSTDYPKDTSFNRLMRPKMSLFDETRQFMGRVFNSTLSNFLGIHNSCIALWRKHAKKYDYARYNTKLINLNTKPQTKREFLVQDAKIHAGKFSAKHGGNIYRDLLIMTRLNLFTSRHYNGSGRITAKAA